MKTTYSFLLICFFSSAIKAQVNLVPNPSFETSTCCPQGWVYPWLFDGWDLNYNTADFFHSADTINNRGIPLNPLGYQCAATGNSYGGLLGYALTIAVGNVSYNPREYIGGLLSQPLTEGVKYYVSLKVSRGENYWCAINKLGVKFFTQDFTNGGGYTFISNLPPPFINDYSTVYTNDIITDTLGWQTIRGSFVADSAYSTFLIGNFFETNTIDSLMVGIVDSTCIAYYYIDDVCVSTDSLYCENIKNQIINISTDSTIITENSCLNFHIQTDITYDSCQWIFENGSPAISNQLNPSNICYPISGNYDVTFIGYKHSSCADTVTLVDFIQVENLTATTDYFETKSNLGYVLKDNVFSIFKLNELIEYKVIDVTGNTIKQGQLNSNTSIDCNGFNAGMYILLFNQSNYLPIKFIINLNSN